MRHLRERIALRIAPWLQKPLRHTLNYHFEGDTVGFVRPTMTSGSGVKVTWKQTS